MKLIFYAACVLIGGVCGALIALSITNAKAEPEEKSTAEQMCYVLVLNQVLPRCYWR